MSVVQGNKVTELLANEKIAVNWNDAHRRVLKSYREWIRSVRVPTILTLLLIRRTIPNGLEEDRTAWSWEIEADIG